MCFNNNEPQIWIACSDVGIFYYRHRQRGGGGGVQDQGDKHIIGVTSGHDRNLMVAKCQWEKVSLCCPPMVHFDGTARTTRPIHYPKR